jgi:hypothetical protein
VDLDGSRDVGKEGRIGSYAGEVHVGYNSQAVKCLACWRSYGG